MPSGSQPKEKTIHYPETWICSTAEAAAGCKAYSWTVPRDAVVPFVRVAPPDLEPLESLMGDERQPVATHVVEVYARHQIDAKTIWHKVKRALNNFSGNPGGLSVTSTWIDNETSGELEYEPGEDMPAAYLVQGTLHIRYVEE